MQNQDKFKTGFSASIKISTMQTLIEYADILNTSKAEVGRKILEYFIANNKVEDLQA